MSTVSPWITVGISAAALVISVVALVVNFASYRASGARVSISGHRLMTSGKEHWLEVRVTNSGRAEVDIEGGWVNWMGASLSNLPTRLSGGSSLTLIFRGVLPPGRYSGDPLTIGVGLGNGRTILKRIRLPEAEGGVLPLATGEHSPPLPPPSPNRHDWV